MFNERAKMDKLFVFQEKSGDLMKQVLQSHDVLEFQILLENEAKFQSAHKEYEGHPGDIILFRPSEPLWNLAKHSGRPIRWISVLFYPAIVRFIPGGHSLLAPFYVVDAVSPYIPAESPAAKAIQQMAKQAIEEERDNSIGWEASQFALLTGILVQTLRYAAGNGLFQSNETDNSIIKAVEYILAHFTEEIQLSQLVTVTGRRRTYFYRQFKAITGLTPNDFIHLLRIQTALHLLSHTDKSVTEVALESGYNSIHHFNKRFKAYRGVSPREYRKENRPR